MSAEDRETVQVGMSDLERARAGLNNMRRESDDWHAVDRILAVLEGAAATPPTPPDDAPTAKHMRDVIRALAEGRTRDLAVVNEDLQADVDAIVAALRPPTPPPDGYGCALHGCYQRTESPVRDGDGSTFCTPFHCHMHHMDAKEQPTPPPGLDALREAVGVVDEWLRSPLSSAHAYTMPPQQAGEILRAHLAALEAREPAPAPLPDIEEAREAAERLYAWAVLEHPDVRRRAATLRRLVDALGRGVVIHPTDPVFPKRCLLLPLPEPERDDET